MRVRWLLAVVASLGLTYGVISCGGGKMGGNQSPTPNAQNANAPMDICNCTPDEPASSDYRHNAKHVPLPGGNGQQITVSTILSWPQGPEPAFDAPRNGRELQEFFIPQAWLQFARVNPGDCDVHLEISETADKTAPRVIVETPVDSEYCSARQTIQQQLAAHGFVLNENSGEINPPLPAQVLGLAFQDFNHQRGTASVATVWELHPAIVTLLQ